MIEYSSLTNKLNLSTKKAPQLSGGITESVSIDNYNSGYRYFLELKCPKRKNFCSEQIVYGTNQGSLTLPNAITKEVGDIFVQLIIRNSEGNIIGKSFVSDLPLYIIEQSINATEQIPDSDNADCLSSLVKELNVIGQNIVSCNSEITVVSSKNTEQDKKITNIETLYTQLNDSLELIKKNSYELLYDNIEKNIINGVAYSDALPRTITLDLSKYKKIKVYFSYWEAQGCVDICVNKTNVTSYSASVERISTSYVQSNLFNFLYKCTVKEITCIIKNRNMQTQEVSEDVNPIFGIIRIEGIRK